MAARGGQTRIGGIVIDILGNSVGFQKELKEADRAAARFAAGFSKQWKATSKQLGDTTGSVLNLKSALLGLAGAAGVGALVKNTLDYADAVSDASDALGLSTKAYQELSFAAAQAGVGQDKFTASFSKFVQLAEGASQGEKGPAATFERLGISAQEAGGDVEALFNLVVQQLDRIPTQNERLSLIGDLFGKKVATQWAATLSGGSQGLAEMREQAQQLGLVLEDSQIRALGKLADQLDMVKTKFEIAFAEGLIEGMTGKTGELVDLVKDSEVQTALGQWAGLFESIGRGAGSAADQARGLLPVLQELERHPWAIAMGLGGAAVGGAPGAALGTAGGFILDELMGGNRGPSPFMPDNSPQGGMEGPPLPPGFVVPAAPAAPSAASDRPLGSPSAAGSGGGKAGAADKEARAAEKARERLDQFVASLRAEVEGLQLEAAAMGLSAQAQQEAAIQKELLNTLTDKGIQLGSVEAQQVEDLIRQKAQLANDKAANDILAGLDSEIASTREQIDQLGMLTEARAREQAVAQAMAEAQSKGIVLTDREIAQIQEKAGLIGKLAALNEQAVRVGQDFADAAQILGDGFGDAVLNGEKLSDVIDNIGEALARLALQRMVIDPFVNAAGSIGTAFVQSLGGGGTTAVAKSAAIGPDTPAFVVPDATARSFATDEAARAVASNDVGTAPEINVMVQTPPGHTASVGSKPNGSGGIDMEILVEQLEQKMTQNTLRGRGFTPMLRAMGVNRTGMSG